MNNKGGIQDDLIITKTSDGFLIILNAACKYNDYEVIKSKLDNQYKLNLDEALSLIALQGPEAKNVLNKVSSDIHFSCIKTSNFSNFLYYFVRFFIFANRYIFKSYIGNLR